MGESSAAQAGSAMPVIILNPTSAGGRARRLRPLLERAVRQGRAELLPGEPAYPPSTGDAKACAHGV